MSEVVYSKKQLNPILEKYSINPLTNMNFQAIVTMFKGQTPYQIWAIKQVFGLKADMYLIQRIKVWADANKTEIQNLSKGNITSYVTKSDFSLLLQEIDGLIRISTIRNSINKFNTAQRELLRKELLGPVTTQEGRLCGHLASTNTVVENWAALFSDFEKLSKSRKEKIISLSSATTSLSIIKTLISDGLSKSYSWNKEDLLSYIAINTPNVKVVHNEGDIVVLTIPDFESSRKICGGGRTSWCLTREESYFKNYVNNLTTHQYFFFDFSKKENDELAHVGFTVKDGMGITNAHSTKNLSMTSHINYKGQQISIHDVLDNNHIPKSVYCHLHKLVKYAWNYDKFMEYVSLHPESYSVSYSKNNRIILRVMNRKGADTLLEHTLINKDALYFMKDGMTYVLLDFNLDYNDEHSVVALTFIKDKYQTHSLNHVYDAYNVNIKSKNYLASIDIPISSFLNCEHIDPRILLHKLIDENNEDEAINLITSSGENFDVNYEFNSVTPIFNAIDHKLYKVFSAIINHKMFKSDTCDGFGESLLQSLLYQYKIENVTTREDDHYTEKMINIILDSDEFDFNIQNINLDTAINVAVERPELLWVVEKLVNKPNVDLNVINDFNCTALGNAIRYKNTEAIKLLATRSDLIVRDVDVKSAKSHNIDLNSILNTDTILTQKIEETSDSFYELFAKAFANS